MESINNEASLFSKSTTQPILQDDERSVYAAGISIEHHYPRVYNIQKL